MDSQIDLPELRQRLMALRWSALVDLSKRAGLPASTVDKIRRDISKQPSFQRVQAIAKALNELSQQPKPKRAKAHSS